ncbi:exopolyphosphatase [Pelistega ratti]|uniref:exopolyphosphatase n=1 Tax=Pelistega ratti TaxID=2652177 RepID=UPI001358E85A|nr:exopolyphosphatase [Pelistega ratti]
MDHLLAAVDLGSNSFRLSVGRVVHSDGIPQIFSIDRLKETVRLAAGLDDKNVLSPEAIQRAVDVLQRFGERIQDFSPDQVRAVATNTFRVARNIDELLPRAEAALGFPIEIIPGHEEARLIFSGVAHELPPSKEGRLVVDIGGGSTEFIIGKGLEPKLMKSLHIGCVSYTKAYFPNGKVTEKAFEKAELAASKEIEVISKTYRKMGWEQAFGSSGSAKAIIAVLQSSGYSDYGITLNGMLALKQELIRFGSAQSPKIKGLKTDRAEVLPAGLAIMIAIFRSLEIDIMRQGEGALRVGVLYDMLGRRIASDKRDETVKIFMDRYHIDTKQAYRVKNIALSLYDSLPSHHADDIRLALSWAADLHEIGLSISQLSFYKHTAYVLEHADMPGFSRDDQRRLSILTLVQQGRLSKTNIQHFTTDKWQAILCLRLAILFARKRQNQKLEGLSLTATPNKQIILSLDKTWLDKHPLTRYSLELEAQEWQAVGFDFRLKE